MLLELFCPLSVFEFWTCSNFPSLSSAFSKFALLFGIQKNQLIRTGDRERGKRALKEGLEDSAVIRGRTWRDGLHERLDNVFSWVLCCELRYQDKRSLHIRETYRFLPYNQGKDSSHAGPCMLCKALSHSLSHLIL